MATASTALDSPSPAVPLRSPVTALHVGYLLLFSMIFLPTTYQPAKAALLASVLFFLLAEALVRGRLELHPTVALGAALYAAAGLLYVLRGELSTAPGALRSINVYVLWPLVFTLLISGLRSERAITGIIRTMVIAALAIELYSLSYIFYSIGWLPASLYIPLDQGQEFSLYPTYFAYNLYNIASLFFLVPFLVALLMSVPRGERLPVGRFWIWVATLLGLILVLLSSRRALVVVVAISPLIALAFATRLPQPGAYKRRLVTRTLLGIGSLAVAALVYVGVAFGVTPAALVETTKAAFTSVQEETPRVHVNQFSALLEVWKEQPVLGSGLGAVAPGVVRSAEMPWAYELSYVSLLYHVGLLGVALYGVGILSIVVVGTRLIRRGGRSAVYMVGLITGMMAFLLGNASNPYLEKFDYLWVIFVPLALVNRGLLQRPEGHRRTS